MGYWMYRDSPELTGIEDENDRMAICALSELVDLSSQYGHHMDACGNPDHGSECSSWYDREAGSEETIAWLVAKGVLTMETIANLYTRETDR